MKKVPYSHMEDFMFLISNWVANDILDNSVINILWQYFTLKIDVSKGDSLGALQLLVMAAHGRQTIITKNKAVVTTIAFGERGRDDMLLFGTACQFLVLMRENETQVTDKTPSFRIKSDDDMWKSIVDILSHHFKLSSPYYNFAVTKALNLIFKVITLTIFIKIDIFKFRSRFQFLRISY